MILVVLISHVYFFLAWYHEGEEMSLETRLTYPSTYTHVCFENTIVLVWYTMHETEMLSLTFHQLEKQFNPTFQLHFGNLHQMN